MDACTNEPRDIRAVAIDCDGVLSERGLAPGPLLEAIRGARESGLTVIAVTRRSLEGYRRDFPDVDRWFDAIVAQRGEVFALAGRPGSLSRPRGQGWPGLESVLRRLSIRKRDLFILGDASTERSLLDVCKRGVAVANVDEARRALIELSNSADAAPRNDSEAEQ